MTFDVRHSKKATTDSDIFGISQGPEQGAEAGERSSDRACLPSLFVYRVANGCERRTARTDGEYYIDCKVYHANDARNTDSLELWKKAIVRIKLQADVDSPQWRKPMFYDK
ncbi:hypothetical protein HF086_011592 [Spodoptera exigua]|uniref:Uncharacterized protein n=1 Tax=Spodoptera exigua TaxID=7107 RepID=A0A922MCC0_SPOEX|nr:hypothetical protein HF086_011592 [Spodoptera exigua]